MNNRIDAIYARQSVDKKDSISIESQIEFCKYELKGGNCKEYTDKGYSGKNTDRPKFQELVRDIKRGLIAKVVVYKLDRISRSILDFANMMELFQQYNVEFVSSTEKFDTSTPMGRAMLNICIVFAQLERETIQKRVTDAYYSRSQRGFKMGGKAPYGFHTEPIKMDGINTKKLVVNPDEAANIRLMFEMYAQPTTSYGDITRYFAEQGILFNGKELIRPTLAQMLRNPVYVQADLDVYEFFKSQGTIIVNDAADFTGTNGCYLYQGRDVKPSKKNDLKDQMLVLAPHEGIVPADIWLACRKKLMNNMKIQSARKATHTWLAGKIKCGNCGYALMSINNPVGKQYLRCTKRLDNKSCAGCGKIITSELETVVYQQMVKKLASYKTLTGRKKAAKANPKIAALQVELLHVDSEIEKLVDVCEALLKGGEPDYYEEWKSLIPFDLKSVKIEQLLKEAPIKVYRKILLAENRVDLMAEACEKDPSDLLLYFSALKCSPFAERATELYKDWIWEEADAAANRAEYAAVCQKLKKFSEDSPIAAQVLAQELREKFPRRPAFQDELKKAGF